MSSPSSSTATLVSSNKSAFSVKGKKNIFSSVFGARSSTSLNTGTSTSTATTKAVTKPDAAFGNLATKYGWAAAGPGFAAPIDP
ncbi:hypothetical protein HETIRDRAFT_409738 [Heterobasidion irregulare TC 32-1]|uniref:Uncharacterized protein n=1 Tax=Heterobasidion irregulare (strain TC 32-1) TaxID=747525 RepID=W4KAW5_HETIT|nr:uncharacterized protein HETIRDRAFT_409738 [Heterobasidion irregulare TC 32-1]ETW82216.1 hypothetical protein HETIRDRAFT_409738 [Heterobasidion irregulare TC 32-1]